MANPDGALGGAYNPRTDYVRTGATDTGGTYAGATLTTATVSAGASIVSPVVTGNAGTGGIFWKQCLFTENATSTTHTATFVLPAGSALYDIVVIPQVLWTGGTASLSVGDANAATGWFNAFDLKATDLVLGERLQANSSSYWGAKNGAYLDATAGRFGQQSTNVIGGYCPTAYSVIAVVTVGTPATTVGRTRVYVGWMVGESVTPVLA